MSRPPTDDRIPDPAQDAALSRLYQRGTRAQAPAHLDAAILAEARRTVSPRARPSWAVPLATAAVIVMSVTLVITVPRDDADPAPEARAFADASREADVAQARAPKRDQSNAAPNDNTLARARSAPPVAAEPNLDRATPLADAPAGTAARRAAAPAIEPAAVTAVRVSGNAGAYRFAVTIKSRDDSCYRYTNAWDVRSDDGQLLYRHTWQQHHTQQQVFTLDGGPIPVQPDTVVWILVHVHPSGYAGAMRGSVQRGFERAHPTAALAATFANTAPISQPCEN